MAEWLKAALSKSVIPGNRYRGFEPHPHRQLAVTMEFSPEQDKPPFTLESMAPPRSFYEIELKSLLSPEQYDRLFTQLPQMMKMINEETIHTTRYTPGDLRLRHSDKTVEIVCKEGDPTKICRREVQIPLASMDQLNHFAEVFELIGMQTDPPWTKDKREFEYEMDGSNYIVCLQHIHDFAYLLEVEFLSETDTSHIHEPKLRSIMAELNCEPIEPREFLERIEQYIESNTMR